MVELQMSYDYNANILYVTIIQAKKLKTFSGIVAKPDAFILGYLLPQRTISSMRKTCFVMESSSPFWNQTFVYPNLPLRQLKTRCLEITAWSYNRHVHNEFLGELVLDLSGMTRHNMTPLDAIRRYSTPHDAIRLYPMIPDAILPDATRRYPTICIVMLRFTILFLTIQAEVTNDHINDSISLFGDF
jgi:hypothetical protein